MSATVCLNPLEHCLMLLWVMRDFAVEVRCKFHGAFAGVVNGSKPVDEERESLVRIVGILLRDRFSQEGRIQFAKLM